jgi:hypothetical protein
MTQPVSLGALALDCADPPVLAAFYAKLLGVEPGFTSDNFAAVKVQGVWLSMHRIENYEPPRWPDAASHGHLDFAVHDDLDTAEQRAIELGATKASEQPNPDAWRVLIDPAGHPFCLGPASSYP